MIVWLVSWLVYRGGISRFGSFGFCWFEMVGDLGMLTVLYIGRAVFRDGGLAYLMGVM